MVSSNGATFPVFNPYTAMQIAGDGLTAAEVAVKDVTADSAERTHSSRSPTPIQRTSPRAWYAA